MSYISVTFRFLLSSPGSVMVLGVMDRNYLLNSKTQFKDKGLLMNLPWLQR